MTTRFVTNNWEKPIAFDYAFKMYSFPVGETVEIPIEAACHIFGYGATNKEPFMIRLGLVKTKNDMEEGLKSLAKIVISEEPPRKNHALSPVVERVPLPASKRAGGNLKAA